MDKRMAISIKNILSLQVALVLLLLSLAGRIRAESDVDFYRWEGSVSAGLNSNGWELHGGIAWMPLGLVGLSATVGLDSEIYELADWGSINDPDFDDDYCCRLLFKPSLLLRTPTFLHIESQGLDFNLFAMPGLTIATPGAGSHNSGWCYWNLGAGINAVFDRMVFTLGYSYSTYNLLDGHPYTHHGGYYEENKIPGTHSVFIGLGYKF